MSKNPEVAIIILTTNALAMTEEQLKDVAKLDTGGLVVECLVVDNGSEDGTEDAIKNYKLPNMDYKFIQSGANLGFAGGNNVGIKDAVKRGFDYVILMNNDLILPRDLVIKLTGFLESNADVGIASPKMYFAPGYEFHKDRYNKSELGKVFWYAGGIIDWKNIYSSHRGVDEIDAGQYNQVAETDFANGACVIIRNELFKKIGYLDDSLFLYWEDADFSQRVNKIGYKVIYFPETCIWHKVSASTGGSGSPSNDYFLIRNRYYFAMRYANFRARFAVFRDTLKLVFAGRPWQKKGGMDALIGIKGMGAWAKR
jgi:GT2 family glycosyltransferase